MANRRGWCAWVHDRVVLIKRFGWEPRATYPDFGSNNEVYAAGDYLEIETLGPLVTLAPDEYTTHTERWFLFRDVDTGRSERELYDALLALLATTDVQISRVPPGTAS
jgi:hypothetical protein